MKLDEWMAKQGLTQTDLAKIMDVYPNQIHNILKGKYRPKAEMAKKLRDLSKGLVTLDDLFSIPTYEEQQHMKLAKEKTCMKDESVQAIIFEIKALCEKLNRVISQTLSEKKNKIYSGKDLLDIMSKCENNNNHDSNTDKLALNESET